MENLKHIAIIKAQIGPVYVPASGAVERQRPLARWHWAGRRGGIHIPGRPRTNVTPSARRSVSQHAALPAGRQAQGAYRRCSRRSACRHRSPGVGGVRRSTASCSSLNYLPSADWSHATRPGS